MESLNKRDHLEEIAIDGRQILKKFLMITGRDIMDWIYVPQNRNYWLVRPQGSIEGREFLD
jgi:hypothetical protein